MAIWEKFYNEEIKDNAKAKALIICNYYQSKQKGKKGTHCTKECPFRERFGLCKLYTNDGIGVDSQLRTEKQLEKILNE